MDLGPCRSFLFVALLETQNCHNCNMLQDPGNALSTKIIICSETLETQGLKIFYSRKTLDWTQ